MASHGCPQTDRGLSKPVALGAVSQFIRASHPSPNPKPSHCYHHSQADGPGVWPGWPHLPMGEAQCLACFLLLTYHPGTEPRPPALQADSLPSEPPGKLFSSNPQEETKRKASKERARNLQWELSWLARSLEAEGDEKRK